MDTVWTVFSVVREEAEERIERQPENTKLHNNKAVLRQMKLTLGLFSR
jgi:hypothetical protein